MIGCHCCGALSGVDGQGACNNCGMINATDRIATLEMLLGKAVALLDESKLPYAGGLSFGEKRDAFLSLLRRYHRVPPRGDEVTP